MKTSQKTKILISLIIFCLLLLGCAQQQVPSKKVNSKSKTMPEHEQVLVREIADGKLVEVYDDFVRVSPGKTAQNWMIINNVLERSQTFQITPCEDCVFDKESVTVDGGAYEIVGFKVKAVEGQKLIQVKDKFNNAYGFAKISVIVE